MFAYPGCASELVLVPVDDDRLKEIEPGDPETLGFGCLVVDF